MKKMNVLTDVGGVIFSFDKDQRKKYWIEVTGNITRGVIKYRKSINYFLPKLIINPYKDNFNLNQNFEKEFLQYANDISEKIGNCDIDEFTEKAGILILKDFLINPTSTALLEHLQGSALEPRKSKDPLEKWNPKEVEGIRSFISQVISKGGVFKGYSTGGRYMPDQFHKALGLTPLVGNVITTYPNHIGKEKNVDQILEEVYNFKKIGGQYHMFIDDADNEIGVWLDAKREMQRKNLGNPDIILFKKNQMNLDGKVETNKGKVYVTSNHYENLKILFDQKTGQLVKSLNSPYKIDFTKYDKKFEA